MVKRKEADMTWHRKVVSTLLCVNGVMQWLLHKVWNDITLFIALDSGLAIEAKFGTSEAEP